jgi:mannosyltransferase OCH1-like enzyme
MIPQRKDLRIQIFPVVHQIFLSEIEREIPASVLKIAKYCGPNHRLWNLESIRKFLGTEYTDPKFLYTFDKLKPYAYKADFARYCILNFFGGYYVDVSVVNFKPFETSGLDMLVFRDGYASECHSSWNVSNGIFFSVPNNEVLKNAIKQVTSNVRDEYYGKHPTWPTGPSVFGKALARSGDKINLEVGELRYRTIRRNTYLLPNGKVCARGKRRIFRLWPLNMLENVRSKFSNYGKLWRNKDCYN